MAVWDRRGTRVLDERLASQPTQSRLLDTVATMWAESPSDARSVGRLAGALRAKHRSRSNGSAGHRRRGRLPDRSAWRTAGRSLQRLLSNDGLQFALGQFFGVRRLRQRLSRRAAGKRLRACLLRRGTAGSAEGALRFIKEVVRKCASLAYVLDLRLDAGFTHGLVMDYLTERKWRFLGRLQGNPVLDRLAEPYLKRPVGRPPKEGYEDVFELGMHQAESWKHPQRLLLVVIDQPDPVTGQLNLLPDYFFLVTNRPVEEISGEASLAHYRRRGTFEDRLGEFNAAVAPRLSSPEFEENEATLLLALLAFNLASLLRGELEDHLGGCWDLGRFQRSVLKAGARVVKGSRQLKVDLAQAVVPLWEHLLNRLRRWILPARWSGAARGRTSSLAAASAARISARGVTAVSAPQSRIASPSGPRMAHGGKGAL